MSPHATALLNMAENKTQLEEQDRTRDAAFNKALHGDSAFVQGGIRALISKGGEAQKAAVDEYFKHWDNKAAKDETAETRKVIMFFAQVEYKLIRPLAATHCRICYSHPPVLQPCHRPI